MEIQKTNVGIRIIILEILYQLLGKTNYFDFFFYNITSSQNINGTQCSELQQRQRLRENKIINIIVLTFSAEICLKMDLGLEIEKINVGIKISILTILCVSIFRQNRQFCIFWPKFAQKWI